MTETETKLLVVLLRMAETEFSYNGHNELDLDPDLFSPAEVAALTARFHEATGETKLIDGPVLGWLAHLVELGLQKG